MQILISLGIIAPIVLLGFVSRKFNAISQERSLSLNSFVYYFALPALFIAKISHLDLANLNLQIIWGSVLPIFILLALLLLLRAIKILKKEIFILLSLSVVFSSNAFFGVPFFESFAGQSGLEFAIITSSILGPLGIIISIFLFEYANKKGEAINYLKKIFLNPLILSIIIGIIFSIFKFNNNFLIDSLDLLGKTAGPVAIFSLGMFIHDNFSLAGFKKSIPFSLFRLIFLPIAAFLTIFLLSIDMEIKNYLVLQTGLPVAISLVVFARRYNYNVNCISNIVIVSSLASFISLSVLFFLSNKF